MQSPINCSIIFNNHSYLLSKRDYKIWSGSGGFHMVKIHHEDCGDSDYARMEESHVPEYIQPKFTLPHWFKK